MAADQSGAIFEQHPVPQQISSYEFRLVGDMTLKQFMLLASGAVIALIIYSLPMPALIQWPLIIFSAISGAAFAFLPIQERPLEHWLGAFFKSIYSPTIFKWEKLSAPPQYFAPSNTAVSPAKATSKSEAKHMTTPHSKNLEVAEKNYLSKITELFAVISSAVIPQPQPQEKAVVNQTGLGLPKIAPAIAPTQSAPQQGHIISEIKSPQTKSPFNQNPVMSPRPTIQPRVVASAPIRVAAPDMAATPVAKPVNMQAEQIFQTLAPRTSPQNIKPAKFSLASAPPIPSDKPNTIVGQVHDSDEKIVETAILEIKDSEGRPVRAFKTNTVGHFRSVTPLPDGKYTITVEKEGLMFDPVAVTVTGKIVQPISIKARSSSTTN